MPKLNQKPIMSLDKTDSLREAQDLLANLNLWKEESHRQVSRIINSHSSSISTGFNTLLEENRSLQIELSVIRKEKAVLLETVDNLNGEISQLNTRLQSLPKPKEEKDQDIIEAVTNDIQHDPESGTIGTEHGDTEADAVYEQTHRETRAENDRNIENISTAEKADMAHHVTQAKTMIEIKIKKFKCQCCPYSSIRKGDLTRHARVVHEKSYVCEQCDFATSQKSALNQHTLSAHSKGAKKFPCDQCSYISVHRGHIEKHVKAVHMKIKDLVCGDCGYATSRKENLTQHRIQVHKLGEKKFKCELCPYKTYIKQSLTRHLTRRHQL